MTNVCGDEVDIHAGVFGNLCVQILLVFHLLPLLLHKLLVHGHLPTGVGHLLLLLLEGGHRLPQTLQLVSMGQWHLQGQADPE